MKESVKVIAFYLPQFHPIKENDEWWGKGFTEWHNVVKAKPLFRGHYQPKLPADLGFYDLRLSETREAQAQLAREAGVYGFCYWHYWFGNGKRLLERPFDEVVASGKPDFPFCLAWANHSWYAKTWDPNKPDRLLIEQLYPGKEDNEKHFYEVLPAFKDDRYIKIDGKPLFAIFKPLQVENVQAFIQQWQELAKKNGLPGIYFVGQGPQKDFESIMASGFDAVNHEEVNGIHAHQGKFVRTMKQIERVLLKRPRCYDYAKAMKEMIIPKDSCENILPTICPNFDHTPRSGTRGLVYTNSNPTTFYNHVRQILDVVSPKQNRIVFLKSWNEWGEGNYMEPDEKYGKGYIKAMRRAMIEYDRDK